MLHEKTMKCKQSDSQNDDNVICIGITKVFIELNNWSECIPFLFHFMKSREIKQLLMIEDWESCHVK